MSYIPLPCLTLRARVRPVHATSGGRLAYGPARTPDSLVQDFGVAIPGRGDRDRTCDLRVWRPPLYRLSYTPLERPAGFEPAWTALQTAALPLGHSRVEPLTGLEPALSVWKTDVHFLLHLNGIGENGVVRRQGLEPCSQA